jgi:hypothetical protein
MERPEYTIKELEKYLLNKKAGATDMRIAQAIENDPFLQTVVIGLERTMTKNNNVNTTHFLEEKKNKTWLTLSPTLTMYNNNNTNTTKSNIFEKISHYFSLRNYDPQYLRIHLLLGFNCSCVLALVITACWLNSSEESTMLISHLEELAGYKP